MSIIDARNAAQAGIGAAGNVQNVSMSYVPENRRLQRLTITGTANGQPFTLTEDVPPEVDLSLKARELTTAYAATLT